MLRAGAAGTGVLAAGGAASARGDGASAHRKGEGGNDRGTPVDEPEGFEVEVLQGHAPFVDEVSATTSLAFGGNDGADGGGPPIGAHVHLDDESTMIVAEVTWLPGGSSGWHRHPGVVLVSMLEGEVEVTWALDCVPRTYSAGEGFYDPGAVHIADNASDDEGARAYAVFLGVPDGAPATVWVEPVDCCRPGTKGAE